MRGALRGGTAIADIVSYKEAGPQRSLLAALSRRRANVLPIGGVANKPPPAPKRPPRVQAGGTAALASGAAHAPPKNSLETRAGLVLVASTERLPVAHPFESDTVTIGRAEGCHVKLWDTASSQNHARVDFEDGAWVIRDLRSHNGTYVNAQRVLNARLEPSSIVTIGNNVFKFVRAAIESYAHYDVDANLRGRPFDDEEEPLPLGELIGGYRMHRLARRLRRLAPSLVPVAIAGETGTEKLRVARQLHAYSQRRGGFLAMPAGDGDHRALAWAVAGRVTQGCGGTLYLDDAGDLGPEDIVALERMLASAQAGLVLGVGANRVGGETDPYVVAIPPLRDRKEDLRALVHATLHGLGASQIDVDYPFFLGLAHYEFPANLEELERILQNALAARTRDALGKEELPRGLRARMARAFHGPQR